MLEGAIARLERRCGATDLASIAASIVSISFDKDDALSAEWVAGAANVRAGSFGIPSADLCEKSFLNGSISVARECSQSPFYTHRGNTFEQTASFGFSRSRGPLASHANFRAGYSRHRNSYVRSLGPCDPRGGEDTQGAAP